MAGRNISLRACESGLLLVGVLTSGVWAGESPKLLVYGASSEIIIDTITNTPADSHSQTGFKAHAGMAYLNQAYDGRLTQHYTVGQSNHGTQYARRSYSNDYGLTWTQQDGSTNPTYEESLPGGMSNVGISQWVTSSGNTSYSFDSFVGAANDLVWDATKQQYYRENSKYKSTDGGYTWSNDGATKVYYGGTYGNRPYRYAGNYTTKIVKSGSTMYATAFGIRNGEVNDKYESILLASTDNGVTWEKKSTIAAHDSSASVRMTPIGDFQGYAEGPGETALVELDNGDLLAVFRTGDTFPHTQNDISLDPHYDDDPTLEGSLYWAKSSDGGSTWSTAKMLGEAGIAPQMTKLSDGKVVLAYGRPGIKFMVADATGERWSMPYQVYDGPGWGQAGLARVTPTSNNIVITYDKSSFYPPAWDNHIGGYSNYRRLDGSGNEFAEMAMQQYVISSQAETEFWDYEYHGDKALQNFTTSSDNWDYASISSGVDVFEYAWKGQDYMRIDTGTDGTTRYGYYEMYGSNGNLPWGDVDFADGLEVEFRARVGEDTTEGSASLMLSDSSNGYIVLELFGDGAALHGLGGNAQQLEHLESGNPGFSTTDWHTYRIEFDWDSGIGDVLATLSIDGVLIGSQELIASSYNLVRIGDGTGSGNGRMDVDFFRFRSDSPGYAYAGVPEPGTLIGLTLLGLGYISLGRRREAHWSSPPSHPGGEDS